MSSSGIPSVSSSMDAFKTPLSLSLAPDAAAFSSSVNKLQDRARDREALLSRSSRRKNKDEDPNTPALSTADFSDLELLPDHSVRPCWVCPDGTIYLEAFHDLYTTAYDFLVAIAEPVARPEFVHEYKLTPFSLYAAVATNIGTEIILRVLGKMSKCVLPPEVTGFITSCTSRYGKAKLVLKHNKFYVESEHPKVLMDLLSDPAIAQARVAETGAVPGASVDKDGFVVQAKAAEMDVNMEMCKEPGDDDDDDDESEEEDDEEMSDAAATEGEGDSNSEKQRAKKKKKAQQASSALPSTVSFQVSAARVEDVKRHAIDLDYPLMEEYDFRNDAINEDIPMDLKPHTRIRRYQERSLAKMFGNGRARSGIIVLPCGAGKTLTGVTAAQTVKKSCICLCTNAVSVLQWKYQFRLWTNIPEDRIACFTSDSKEPLHPGACLLITTYTMVSYGGKRSDKSAAVMDAIRGREWGLMLMDEVHVVPAKMFRKVIASVKSHCKLGLTATLVREDDLIGDLNYLIGPKLYEANWMDLTSQGYLANVQCVEVWCPMTGPFMKEYLLAKNARMKQLLYVMNPSKVRAVEYLVNFHEERGDKIIVFSDLVYSLKQYAVMLKKPLIYGETPERERQSILGTFRTDSTVKTICLSKVGDTSIDLPEANVIIQVSSHFGSRRQEAQRLGRILRPKSFTATDGSNRDSFNAYFYTLISTDTQEMFYSAKRQQYLIDQGYTFKIVTNLNSVADDAARASGFKYSTPEEDRGLLLQILRSDSEMERSQRAEDNAIRKGNADGAVLIDEKARRAGNMAAGGVARARAAGPPKRHSMFQKRSRK